MSSTSTPSALASMKPFAIGGVSGCFATACIQPIDMVKVQLQLMGDAAAKSSSSSLTSRNPFKIATTLIKTEGFTSLYRGLDAGLMRQITYTTARVGLFRMFSDLMTQTTAEGKKVPLPFYKKLTAGFAAGGLGSLIGNPCDLSLVRMQADATLPVSQRRNYTGIFNAIGRIVKEEGFFSLWRGATPTVSRAMVLNAAMFASSDQTKEKLIPIMGETKLMSLTVSAIAGFWAATMSLPFDFLKTRLQKMKPDANGQMPYKNMLDCAVKVFKNEGPMRFYSGYPVYYFRVAPHAMITLLTIDVLTYYLR